MQRVVKNWKDPAQFIQPHGVFQANTVGRRFMSVANVAHREGAFAAFGFEFLQPEPLFRNFIGEHFLDGAHTHEHQDPSPEGFIHVRVNWMVKKPKSGGDPVINGKIISVDEGDLWVCFSSEERHASTPICGGIRKICSFGALVPRPINFNINKVFE